MELHCTKAREHFAAACRLTTHPSFLPDAWRSSNRVSQSREWQYRSPTGQATTVVLTVLFVVRRIARAAGLAFWGLRRRGSPRHQAKDLLVEPAMPIAVQSS